MSGRHVRWLVTVAMTLLAAACSHSPRPAPGTSPAAPGSPAAASATSAPNPNGKPTPIIFEAPKLGNKYIYLSESKRNRKMYLLRADSEKGVYFGENTGQSTFVNPHITFYGSDGKRVVADAPRGLAVERLKTVRLTDGVHAVSQDGVRLTSDSMLYDGATETIHAQGHVVMNSPQGSELQGDTLDWNLHSGAVDVAGAH
jgi:LPS export ABC transporter protein LptC